MKRGAKPRHELSGLTPTLDLLFTLDKGICWLCGKEVDRKAASLDHAVPKSLMGSKLRFYKSFSNSYLAHKKCNRIRGNPVPDQGVIRWDRLVEEDHDFIRHLFKRMEFYWGKPKHRVVKRFLDGVSDHIPFTRRKQ